MHFTINIITVRQNVNRRRPGQSLYLVHKWSVKKQLAGDREEDDRRGRFFDRALVKNSQGRSKCGTIYYLWALLRWSVHGGIHCGAPWQKNMIGR